ncbi:DEAD/DEAH box helicase family protein [Paenibacillus sp. SYP-B3998]|uniref:DNA 3'-5' helicase n=1 Tax=Paenibacillus sp. SYP-B3998 TaxID=2678564 RepID=A0A6G3ZTH6_9BACL|nr:DNA repair helicase XPB [Paenibacillus sp. SYP-B3998]NEW05442.1 DEAD/DEAH box helicase family protein [Paenibacillus sp. SYP-B3998]
MNWDPTRPLIVQNDLSVLLETHHLEFEQVRRTLSRFAVLLKSPDHLHTYRITPLSLWNAAAAGMQIEEMLSFLQSYAKFGVPTHVMSSIRKYSKRYGLLRLENVGHELYLVSDDTVVLKEICGFNVLKCCLQDVRGERAIAISADHRGFIKQELIKLGYPVEDLAAYRRGEYMHISLLDAMDEVETPFQLRDYQKHAVDAFQRIGDGGGVGSGVLVLPCGAGKTVVGIAAMARCSCATLILTSNVTSVRQWKREILAKTGLSEADVGEYNGTCKDVRPITIATYQILTHRGKKEDEFSHMRLFNEREWGLIIYDEVHLLPAPVFRATANIQATRRLGLTATLIREDGREDDVFSLVGPKRYEMAWKELEAKGWIAKVACKEIRVPLSSYDQDRYGSAGARQQFRMAGENVAKLKVIDHLLQIHANEQILIIGQYIDQLKRIAAHTGASLISGGMAHDDREELYERFKTGSVSLLIVSKVANFAVDLPDAAVAIQVSGSYGSRQEEAQRLGRILRPKSSGANVAVFYSLISEDTKEQDFAIKRQLFLVEQGYQYRISSWKEDGQNLREEGQDEVQAHLRENVSAFAGFDS